MTPQATIPARRSSAPCWRPRSYRVGRAGATRLPPTCWPPTSSRACGWAARHKVEAKGLAANSYAPFAAAVAAARILGLRGDAFYQALGWAYAQCAGAVQLQQAGRSAL